MGTFPQPQLSLAARQGGGLFRGLTAFALGEQSQPFERHAVAVTSNARFAPRNDRRPGYCHTRPWYMLAPARGFAAVRQAIAGRTLRFGALPFAALPSVTLNHNLGAAFAAPKNGISKGVAAPRPLPPLPSAFARRALRRAVEAVVRVEDKGFRNASGSGVHRDAVAKQRVDAHSFHTVPDLAGLLSVKDEFP